MHEGSALSRMAASSAESKKYLRSVSFGRNVSVTGRKGKRESAAKTRGGPEIRSDKRRIKQ